MPAALGHRVSPKRSSWSQADRRTASWGSFNVVAETASPLALQPALPREKTTFGVRSRPREGAGPPPPPAAPAASGARSRRATCAREPILGQPRSCSRLGICGRCSSPRNAAAWSRATWALAWKSGQAGVLARASWAWAARRSIGKAAASWRATLSITLRPRRCSPRTTLAAGFRSQTRPSQDRTFSV